MMSASILLRKKAGTALLSTAAVSNAAKPIVSGLYVPGNQSRMLRKCVLSRATLLVPDMEDSVPLDEKPLARELIRDELPTLRREAALGPESVFLAPRTNGLDTGLFHDDVSAMLPDRSTADLVDGFCVPKVDTVEQVREIDSCLSEQETRLDLPPSSLKVIPHVESTVALVNIRDLLRAGRDRFVAVALGGDDFTADFEVPRSPGDEELDLARRMLALHCHAAGVTSIDTPYVRFRDADGLEGQLRYLKGIGMKAKLAIHPTQVEVINRVLCPSQEEVAYCARLVETYERAERVEKKSACVFDDKMIDVAAYRRAKALLRRAKNLNIV